MFQKGGGKEPSTPPPSYAYDWRFESFKEICISDIPFLPTMRLVGEIKGQHHSFNAKFKVTWTFLNFHFTLMGQTDGKSNTNG